MALRPPHHAFTYAEYLERERVTGLKHEWLAGQIYAMAGGTLAHAHLISMVTSALTSRLDGARCRVFTSELKIRVVVTGLATYPDVAVICGAVARDLDDPNAATNPRLIVEVLSPSTEEYDRGEKWAHYRSLPSLEAYLLVSQAPPHLELWTRTCAGDDDDAFVRTEARVGEELAIPSLDARLAVDPIYATVSDLLAAG